MLCDLGAEVIKIEPPDGDLTRFSSPKVGSMATYFMQQNAGKRCISVDLARPEGADIFRRLVTVSDVLIENYRAGVMDRLYTLRNGSSYFAFRWYVSLDATVLV